MTLTDDKSQVANCNLSRTYPFKCGTSLALQSRARSNALCLAFFSSSRSRWQSSRASESHLQSTIFSGLFVEFSNRLKWQSKSFTHFRLILNWPKFWPGDTLRVTMTSYWQILHHPQWFILHCSGGSRIFLKGDANSQIGCANLLFCKYFAENSLKMKELGNKGGEPPWRPLGSANALCSSVY